jgi:hypothetical protein
VSLAVAANAAPYDELIAGRKPEVRLGAAPSGKRTVLVDGQPVALSWACLTAGGENYRRAGFNALMVELTYPGRDVSLEQAFAQWDEQLLAVQRQGLWAIVYLHNSIHAGVTDPPWALDEAWRRYVQAIVRRYRPMTNLVGWIFADEYGDHVTFPDEAFRDYLRTEYGTIGRLNAVWRTAYASFAEARLEYQRAGHGRPEPAMVQPEFPFGIGPKALDSARFKLVRAAEANARFEQVVREVDPLTPLWSGANNLGWAIPPVPTGWGAYVDFYPEFSGNDRLTQHVWAMDIARGPNARPAMQMLLPEHSTHYNWHLDARVLRGWMVESALHGAAGITFWPWSFLGVDNRAGDRSPSIERVDTVGVAHRQLKASGLMEMLARPTIAVLYEPYAEGWGNMSQVWGVLRHPSGEPLPLMEELRFGTRYGQVEYLTQSTLDQARYDGYGVILAPFACELTPAQVARLRDYVEQGGVLLADVGFDCLRGGKTVTSMPPDTRALFGIGGLAVSDAAPGRWQVTTEGAALLPGLSVAEGTEALRDYALDVTPTTAVPVLHGPGGQGLFANRVGSGLALYCSALGWGRSLVRDPLLRKLHEALFARRAVIELCGETDWSEVEQRPFFAQGCEVFGYRGGYALRNMTAEVRQVTVRVNGEERQHALPAYGVLLVRDGEQVPLGPGLWPIETGPAPGE